MKRLYLVVVGLIVAVLAVLVVVRIAVESKHAREWLQDPRWQEAVENYKKARERNAPQVELEERKREIGVLVRQLRTEQAKA
jgi:uncharacterized MAPEG superfamily protein